MYILKTAKISSRGQIVIPQKIRESLSLEPKDEMVFITKGNNIILKKLHFGDILKEAREDYDNDNTLSQEEMEKRYGL
jgi:AbrB family looped-hinge helix DNA binding protein